MPSILQSLAIAVVSGLISAGVYSLIQAKINRWRWSEATKTHQEKIKKLTGEWICFDVLNPILSLRNDLEKFITKDEMVSASDWREMKSRLLAQEITEENLEDLKEVLEERHTELRELQSQLFYLPNIDMNDLKKIEKTARDIDTIRIVAELYFIASNEGDVPNQAKGVKKKIVNFVEENIFNRS